MKHLEPTEHEIMNLITSYLRAKRYYVLRLNSGMIPMIDHRGRRRMIMMGERGTPDLLAFRGFIHTNVYCGKKSVEVLFIECKRKGKKPTPAQEMKMQQLEEKGARCIVAADIKDLEVAGI